MRLFKKKPPTEAVETKEDPTRDRYRYVIREGTIAKYRAAIERYDPSAGQWFRLNNGRYGSNVLFMERLTVWRTIRKDRKGRRRAKSLRATQWKEVVK